MEGQTPVLRLYNSLTRKKDVFQPRTGNRVLWYSCGPTVYDVAHMGHARSYISFDILRRILSDYFGYDVTYVMNITDIDDKIIKRARHNYLFDRYADEARDLVVQLDDAKLALGDYSRRAEVQQDADKRKVMSAQVERMEAAVDGLKSAVKSGDNSKIDLNRKRLLEESREPLSEWLDTRLGAGVSDHRIFEDLSRHFERQFNEDMSALGVQPPDVLTRVSEYVPEIVIFVQKLIERNLAYESNGSVYFDVATFNARPGHKYARLVPEAYGDAQRLQEGEGELTVTTGGEKKAQADFALWKRSRAGEPSWESPWGLGRPGWHIECSCMATEILGAELDVHAGGVDLKFPHHDNELAQSEAYHDRAPWVRHFLHSGHLTIAGCKMSKSLKNFVSIRDALQRNTSRQLRLAFLLHGWRDTLDYSERTMETALAYERSFTEFFLSADELQRSRGHLDQQKPTELELAFLERISTVRADVHRALCDDVDTRSALDALRQLVSATNVYIRQRTLALADPTLVHSAAAYVTRILTLFGAAETSSGIGWGTQHGGGDSKTSSESLAYLQLLADFRLRVREKARNVKAVEVLAECDSLRDDRLPELGVRLEDREDGPPAIKLVGREEALRERDVRKKADEQKAAEALRKKEEAERQKRQKEEQRKIPPTEMFKMETDKYSQFDDKGLPTHDVDGKELSKGLTKKLAKLQLAQEKRYQEFVTSVNSS